LYPSSPYAPSPHVRVFRTGAEYGSTWGEQSAERITVSRANRFSDLDRTTLERIEMAAGLRGKEPIAGAAEGSASQATPDAATLRRASYNPTTPSTQVSATNLRVASRTYDDLDRLSRETVQLEDGSTATLIYTYWKNGQRKTVTDAVGRVTFYEYDGQHRLSRLTVNQGLPDEQVTSYGYWPDSLLKTVTKPNGTVSSYDYDAADRLRSVVVRKDGIDLVSYAYIYDGNGNRTSQVEVNGGPAETTTYTYDDLNRLETVTYPDGRSVAYGYDDVGNRRSDTERDPAGVVVSEKVAVFDAANRLSTVTDAVNPANNATFAYDRNGNLARKTTAAGTTTYTYDVRDQLVETREGEGISARFAYDAFGRRYLKIGHEGLRQYLYDQTSLLEEFSELNVEVAKYDWGGDRLLSLRRIDEPRRYFHFDVLGSVAALTEESGSVAARYHYDAWGRYRSPAELEASANRFGFTGHYFDTETKLYNAKARYFDPAVGRFTTADSFLGSLDQPPSLHRYVYAANRPTYFVDPTGHEFTVNPDKKYGPNEVPAPVLSGTVSDRDLKQYLAYVEKHGFRAQAIQATLGATGVYSQAYGQGVAKMEAAAIAGTVAAAPVALAGGGAVAVGAVGGAAQGFASGLLDEASAAEVGVRTSAGAALGGALGWAAQKLGAVIYGEASPSLPGAGQGSSTAPKPVSGEPAPVPERLPVVAGGSQAADAVPAPASAEAPSSSAAAGQAVPAGTRLIGKGDPVKRAVDWVKPQEGLHDVLVHGTPTSFQVLHNGKVVTLDQRSLATFISKSGHKGGDVRLLSCSTGACDAGAAQNLANKLGVNVTAPTDTLWIHRDGTLTIGPTADVNTGTWRVFTPGKK
jgi:RHS repeat-associated protein